MITRRLITRRVVLPAVLLLACVASWLIANAMNEQAPVRAAALPGDGLDRPLVSTQRVSATGPAAESDLVAPIVASIPPPPSPQSCSVVVVDGEVVSSTRPDLPLIPGTAQMLVTGWGALALLGPDHRFVTAVRSESAPSTDGVVSGSLYLVGGGDPVLMTPEWAAANQPGHTVMTDPAQLADAVADAGVSQVFGAVIGIEDRYDQLRSLPGLATADDTDDALGRLGALRIDGAELATSNQTTVDLSNPAATSAASFDDLLEARGIAIAGLSRVASSEDELPDLVDIASVQSAPLSQIVSQMLVENDVVIAELLVKEVGYVLADEGSTLAGARLIFDAARDVLGVDFGAPPRSGSGWDSIGTATCGSLAAFVQAIDANSFVATQAASYHAAALGEPAPESLTVRGEVGSVVSVASRAPLVVGLDEPEPVEVIIVSITNTAERPSEADRQHVRDLLAAVGTLRDAYGEAASGE